MGYLQINNCQNKINVRRKQFRRTYKINSTRICKLVEDKLVQEQAAKPDTCVVPPDDPDDNLLFRN